MADQSTEQDLLPDPEGPGKGAGGESERDQGVEDDSGVGIGDESIISGDEEDLLELDDEGFEGDE